MEKSDRGQKKKSIFSIGLFSAMLTGILLSIMASMMYIGGGIHLDTFLDTGNVYDFSQKELKSGSKGWVYDEGSGGYWLQNNHALKKFMLDGKEQSWGYLYLFVSEISLTEMQARVLYYNTENEQVGEQPILLHKGENIILLQETLPMYKMGFRIIDAKGQFVSIQSMQAREKALGYTAKRFAKIFGTAFAGYLVVFCCFFVFQKESNRKLAVKGKAKDAYFGFVWFLQYIFQIFTEDAGKHVSGRLSLRGKNEMRIFLFSSLFMLAVAGNVLGWNRNKDFYRFHLYLCFLLIVLIGLISWERPLKPVIWKKPVAISWIFLWTGIAISDFFVKKDFGMLGIIMVLGGGFFIFVWGNMEKKEQMVYNVLDALEKTFWVAVAYCMLFRVKKPAIHYNGIFCSSEEFSAYAVLMLSVFLLKMDIDIKKGAEWKYARKNCIAHVCGGAVAFFFTLRSDEFVGNIVAAILILLFGVKQVSLYSVTLKRQYRLFSYMVQGCVAAILLVVLVHISIKNLPTILELEVSYDKETFITDVDDETIEDLNIFYPGLLDGVKREKDTELRVIWSNYIRKWNLLGNSGNRLKVFRSPVLPDNGYLYVSYKYGLFLLIPYVLYQICLLAEGFRFYVQKKGQRRLDGICFWVWMVGILFTGFCIDGNLEFVTFGHPLWLCYYLGTGCLFVENRE